MIISGTDAHHIHIGFKSSEDAVAKKREDLNPGMACTGPNWLDHLKGRLVVQDAQFSSLDSDNDPDSDSSGDSDLLDAEELEALLAGDSDMDDDSDEDDDMEVDDEDDSED